MGAGPGDPGLLTLRAARAIANCEALVYDALAAPAIVDLAPPGCERIYVGKRADKHTLPQDEITDLIVRLGKEGKRVVRLKGGDVFVFGRGGEEAAELRAHGVPFEVVPGITSAIAAPAYAGIPVTHREHNTSFVVATGHEDPTKDGSTLDFAKLANPHQTLVFLMAMGNLAEIAEKLQAHGLDAETPAAIVCDGTLPTQRTLVATLATIADEAQRANLGAPAVVVIGNVVGERERARWFDASPLFGKRVLVTRASDDADDFATRLREEGAEPVIAPAIAFAPPDDPAPARAVLDQLAGYSWVVFTSRRGVAAAFSALERSGRDARAFGTARVAAVGTRTAALLQSRGIRADLVPETFEAKALAADLLAQTKAPERILIYGAQEMRDTLAETLRAQGRHVDAVAAYKTVAARDPLLVDAARESDIWTFASPSALGAFLDDVPGAVELAKQRTIACIGPVTAAAARERGLHVDVVAEEYTVEGLVAALAKAAP